MRVKILGEYIELQKLLKFAGIVQTGGEAKELVLSGVVLVNGCVEARRSRKLMKGDVVRVEGRAGLIEIDSSG